MLYGYVPMTLFRNVQAMLLDIAFKTRFRGQIFTEKNISFSASFSFCSIRVLVT